MQYFTEQIVSHLSGRGYRQLSPNHNNIYGRTDGDAIYVVVLGSCNGLTAERLKAFDRQILEQISLTGSENVRLLNILLMPDAFLNDELSTIIDEMNNVWMFSEEYGKLYIYENQPDDFDGLKSLLDKEIQAGIPGKQMDFIRRIGIITPVLVILNVLIYIISLLTRDEDGYSQLMYAMTDYLPKVIENKQYYRVITSMFYHFSLAHLASNMIVLAVIGVKVENSIGRFWYLVCYVMCGCASSVCSLFHAYIRREAVFSGGASGAICGLMGILIIFLIFRRGDLKGISLRQMLYMAGATILNGLISTGNSGTSIDNAAHIGGLVAGLFVGIAAVLVQAVKDKLQKKRTYG